jgi:hypothetical protein
MTGIIWTDNGPGRLAHVGGGPGYGIYLGHVSEAHRHPGKWVWKFWFDVHQPGGVVSSRATGMKAIRRKWRAFMERGGLAYEGEHGTTPSERGDAP